MSVIHFQALQRMIEELESYGFKDVTDEVKPFYDGQYFHLCSLQGPPSSSEEWPVSCDTVEELTALLERVDPSRLEQQVWFCEQCQAVSTVRYRKGDGHTEVMEALGRDHRSRSPNCANTYWLRVINTTVIVSQEALVADKSIPAWAVHPVSQLLGFQEGENT